MTERRQFCPRGHDTFVAGRDSSYRCLRCKREDAAASRRAREAEARAARSAELSRQQVRLERERKRERESLTGEALLSALQTEAQLDLRCIWAVSHDPPQVCGVKLRGPDAGTATPYCTRHDRLVEEANEEFKRGGRQASDAFYQARGVAFFCREHAPPAAWHGISLRARIPGFSRERDSR